MPREPEDAQHQLGQLEVAKARLAHASSWTRRAGWLGDGVLKVRVR
jgi:hypothetical protein